MEGILERYLSIFLPFLATVVIAHAVIRSSGAWQLQRLGLGSSDLLRRVLVASGSAIGIIVGVDLVTAGDLFLRPSSPRSEILIAIVLVTLVAAHFASRAALPLARRMRRFF